MSRKHRRRAHREGQGDAAAGAPRAEHAARARPSVWRRLLAGALLLATVLLLAAALPLWREAYDPILRSVVCASALVTAYLAYDERRTGWAITLGLVAIGFNPVWPLGLSRGNWVATYLVVAVVFIAAAARFRRAPQGILRPPPRIP